jgi:hypothetical protein
MRYKFLILLFLLILLLFLKNYDFNIKENPRIINSYNMDEDVLDIEKILKTEKIINKLNIKRNDFNLLNIKDDFTLYVEEKDFELDYIENIVDIPSGETYSFFDDYHIQVEDIWKNKKKFRSMDPEKVFFSGVVNENGEKIAYIYFYESLLSIKENELFGDRKVLKIFKDGILLINSKNQFEVIM